MAEPEVIWSDGDPWRDLAPDVVAAGAATVISLRGTTRLVDVVQRRQFRVPLSGGHVMDFDAEWVSLGRWALTPCGLVISASEHWAAGSPVRLVLAGLVPRWYDTEVGATVLEAVRAGNEPSAPGHPDLDCGAAYRPNGPIEAWRRLRRAEQEAEGAVERSDPLDDDGPVGGA